jgi:hypothetical protein
VSQQFKACASPQEKVLNYWTYSSSQGPFSIVERSSRGVDVYFGQSLIAHYRSPVDAAEQIAQGNHPPLACAPDDGVSLGVPAAVHQWEFVRTAEKAKLPRTSFSGASRS